MAISRVTFNTEQTWVQAIHRLAKSASTCRVAVAYCGREAYKFFPETPADRPEDLRIIVDASTPSVGRGLTNPDGVELLLGLTSQIRSLSALHAKVFIFDDHAALVGSTNMSDASILRIFWTAAAIQFAAFLVAFYFARAYADKYATGEIAETA